MRHAMTVISRKLTRGAKSAVRLEMQLKQPCEEEFLVQLFADLKGNVG